jgi:KDO2-lipid IV(A) lauroyltransferase
MLSILAILPLSWLRKIGAIAGSIGLYTSPQSKQRLINNLVISKMCGADDAEKIAKECAKEWGKTLIEIAGIAWARSIDNNAKLVTETENLAWMQEVLAQNKPVLFITPHLGNFEVALKFTAKIVPKRTFTVLFKPSKSELLNEVMLDGRIGTNINPVPTDRKGIYTLAKELKNNGIAGILPDSVSSNSDGVWVDFFGNKVFATTLAAKMSLIANVTTIFAVAYRIKNGFRVEYSAFTPTTNNVEQVVQDIYKGIERIVLKYPQQYYWSYDRFRKPPYAKPIIVKEGK